MVNFQNKDVGDQLPACYEQMLRDARGKITLISFDKLPHPIWASTTWQVLQTESSTKYTFCNRCQFTVLSLSEAGTNVMVCVTSFQITTDALTLSITIICDLCTFGKVLSVTLSSLHLVKERRVPQHFFDQQDQHVVHQQVHETRCDNWP